MTPPVNHRGRHRVKGVPRWAGGRLRTGRAVPCWPGGWAACRDGLAAVGDVDDDRGADGGGGGAEGEGVDGVVASAGLSMAPGACSSFWSGMQMHRRPVMSRMGLP